MKILLQVLFITVLSWLGNLFFKVGADGFGGFGLHEILTRDFLTFFLFSSCGWVVMLSLAINLGARIYAIIPFSQNRFGLMMALISPLALVFSVVSGILLFHESYSHREYIGIVLAILAVFLLGGEGLS